MATKIFFDGRFIVVDKSGSPPIVNILPRHAIATYIAVRPSEGDEVPEFTEVSITDFENNIILQDLVIEIQDITGALVGDLNAVRKYFDGFFERQDTRIVEQSTAFVPSGELLTKSGLESKASFAGNPKKATITFVTAFPSIAYSISVLSNTINNTTYIPAVENILAASFVLNMGTNNVNDLIDTRWVAVEHGET